MVSKTNWASIQPYHDQNPSQQSADRCLQRHLHGGIPDPGMCLGMGRTCVSEYNTCSMAKTHQICSPQAPSMILNCWTQLQDPQGPAISESIHPDVLRVTSEISELSSGKGPRQQQKPRHQHCLSFQTLAMRMLVSSLLRGLAQHTQHKNLKMCTPVGNGNR